MGESQTVIDMKWLKDQIGDAIYQYFDPIRAFSGYLFAPKRYRLKFMYDNGMTTARTDETFTAHNDREARRKAKEIAGENSWAPTLVQYRETKLPD